MWVRGFHIFQWCKTRTTISMYMFVVFTCKMLIHMQSTQLCWIVCFFKKKNKRKETRWQHVQPNMFSVKYVLNHMSLHLVLTCEMTLCHLEPWQGLESRREILVRSRAESSETRLCSDRMAEFTKSPAPTWKHTMLPTAGLNIAHFN